MKFPSPEWDKLLKKKLRAKAVTISYSTKAELVAYYQSRKDEGEIKSWKKALVDDILAYKRGILPPARTGDKKADKAALAEYQRQEKNVGKRFEPKRLGEPEPKNVAEYAALGKKLGVTRTPPPEGFKINWNADLCISNKCGYIRGFTTTFTGQAAQDLLDTPKIYLVVDAYFTDGGLDVVDDLSEINSEDSPVNGVKKVNWLRVNPRKKKGED